MKIKKIFTKTNLILMAIFLLGIFLRFYQIKERFIFNHDHDLTFWIVKDVLLNKHLRLIGQETSTQGIFIGLFGIFSSYWVFSKSFDKKTGLIASFLYALSFTSAANDREAVPTMPVI